MICWCRSELHCSPGHFPTSPRSTWPHLQRWTGNETSQFTILLTVGFGHGSVDKDVLFESIEYPKKSLFMLVTHYADGMLKLVTRVAGAVCRGYSQRLNLKSKMMRLREAKLRARILKSAQTLASSARRCLLRAPTWLCAARSGGVSVCTCF